VVAGLVFMALPLMVHAEPERPLVSGVIVRIDSDGPRIVVRSASPSKALGPGKDIQQMTVGNMSSTGNGSVTASKAIRRKGHVYLLNVAANVNILQGKEHRKFSSLVVGSRVQVLGTVTDASGTAQIDSYKVVNGQLVINTVPTTKTGTATTILILSSPALSKSR
jgi:hypothetical protein